MSTGVKVVLGILLGLVVLCLGTGAAGYFWLNSNKDRLLEAGKRAKDEGRAAGEGHTAKECLALGFSRLDASTGLVDEASARVFLAECLRAAPRDDALCAGVPPRDELVKSAAWAVSFCADAGRPQDQPCARLVQALQEGCHAKRDSR